MKRKVKSTATSVSRNKVLINQSVTCWPLNQTDEYEEKHMKYQKQLQLILFICETLTVSLSLPPTQAGVYDPAAVRVSSLMKVYSAVLWYEARCPPSVWQELWGGRWGAQKMKSVRMHLKSVKDRKSLYHQWCSDSCCYFLMYLSISPVLHAAFKEETATSKPSPTRWAGSIFKMIAKLKGRWTD